MMSPLLWSSGEHVPNQLVGFGGNFLNFKSGTNKRKRGVGRMFVSSMGLRGQQLGQAPSHLAVEETQSKRNMSVCSPINSIASLNQELMSALWLSSTGMLL